MGRSFVSGVEKLTNFISSAVDVSIATKFFFGGGGDNRIAEHCVPSGTPKVGYTLVTLPRTVTHCNVASVWKRYGVTS